MNLAWRKSSRSAQQDCVEVAFVRQGVAVRDSKNVTGPVLAIPVCGWDAFRADLREKQA